MSEPRPLLLLGAGDMTETFAPQIARLPGYEIAGCVVEDGAPRIGASLRNLPLLTIDEALQLSGTHSALSIIGSPKKESLVSRFERAGFEFINFVSRGTDVSPEAVLEPGVLVSSHTVIDPFVRIGRHSIISLRVLVAHHCTIGPYSFVGPGALLTGNTTIGARCFIGAGAILRDGITVGDNATVGAGAVVVEDVPAGTTVVGNPARPLTPNREKALAGKSARKPLLILGAGDMAKTYAREFRDDPAFEIAGFVEDDRHRTGRRALLELPILGVEEALKQSHSHAAICAIGSPERQSLVERFEEAEFEFATLISPTAIVYDRQAVQPGCIICDFANIDPDVSVGRHTIVTSRVTLAHHVAVGEFSFIAASVTTGGHCRIGSRCFIGTGAILGDHIAVGDDATVAAGAVVVRDVESGQSVAGVPARTIRPKKRQPILLLGAGEQAASYAENVADLPGFEIVGFVQDVDPERKASELAGRPVYYIDEVKDWSETHQVVCCIGSMNKREFINRFEAMGFRFATLVASTALVSPKAELGPGCFVSHTGQVASFASVGAHTMIGRQTMVGHHAEVGPYSLVAGGSIIGGGARIGEGCLIGMGALVRDHVTIGEGATVGVGAVVIRDVPAGATVGGNPARILPPD